MANIHIISMCIAYCVLWLRSDGIRNTEYVIHLQIGMRSEWCAMKHNTPIDEFVQACRVEIRGEVRADPITCALFATDASNYQITPLAVVAPCDRDDVAAAMALCARFELPVLPRGGGSSLAGQAVGAAGGLRISHDMDNPV